MTDKKQLLLRRLEQIGRSLEQSGQALALLGLGSVGAEVDRLDDFSDLDFFVIVQAGYKTRFIENLDWLSSICPIAYCFKNTADGYKLLFEDDILCEFAVFEADELSGVTFAAGRIVWQAETFDASICKPVEKTSARQDTQWLLGEALTNLYVGLCRHHRGEKLSAARFIQGYAVDRIVELSEALESERPAHKDVFTLERRYEQRFPNTAKELAHFMQGYTRNIESARAILEFLDRHFEVNPALKSAILALCDHQE